MLPVQVETKSDDERWNVKAGYFIGFLSANVMYDPTSEEGHYCDVEADPSTESNPVYQMSNSGESSRRKFSFKYTFVPDTCGKTADIRLCILCPFFIFPKSDHLFYLY